jgi:hypothetical protein
VHGPLCRLLALTLAQTCSFHLPLFIFSLKVSYSTIMDAETLVERLSAEEAVRKMAAFQLKNQIQVTPEFPLTKYYRMQHLHANLSQKTVSSN